MIPEQKYLIENSRCRTKFLKVENILLNLCSRVPFGSRKFLSTTQIRELTFGLQGSGKSFVKVLHTLPETDNERSSSQSLLRSSLPRRALPLRHMAQIRRPITRLTANCNSRFGLRLVRHGVDSHLHQALFQMGIPVVLDLVVSSLRKVSGDGGPPATSIVISTQFNSIHKTCRNSWVLRTIFFFFNYFD